MAHFIFFLLLFPLLGHAESNDYLSEITQKAQELKLADQREWHLLLHYVPRTLFSGVKSEVDDATFFLSPEGKYKPQKELAATLQSFVENRDSQCKYIARYSWLKSELKFDQSKLPEADCEEYLKWRKSVPTDQVTLVFASYYVNNPASMFGHTLLRFDSKESASESPLLNHAVNFSADAGRDKGFFFALYGLTGLYHGTFSMFPYYFKVREYNNFESRDLFEYRLQFTPVQIDRLLAHLWEMGHTYFDYYFLDENCSYHLLSLLEVANPELHFRDRFHLFVAPSDVLKVVANQPGLVLERTYRPSILSEFRQKQRMLNQEEFVDFKKVLREPKILQTLSLGLERKILIADAGLDYFSYRLGPGFHSPEQKELIFERSALGKGVDIPSVMISSPPELGHDSKRVGLASGIDQNDTFEEFRLRLAFHDLLADDEGYPENSEIEGGAFRFRFYNQERKFHVEEATGIRVRSLFPIDSILFKPSWNVGFGLKSERNRVCGRCNAIYLKAGSGLAYQTHLFKKETFYTYFNLYSDSSPWTNLDYRIGPQAESGIIFDIAKLWRVQLSGSFDYSPLSSLRTDYTLRLDQRLSLSQNLELRIEASRFSNLTEGLLSFHVYY